MSKEKDKSDPIPAPSVPNSLLSIGHGNFAEAPLWITQIALSPTSGYRIGTSGIFDPLNVPPAGLSIFDSKIHSDTNWIFGTKFNSETSQKIQNLESEIRNKEAKIRSLLETLSSSKLEKQELAAKLKEVEDSAADLKKSQELVFLTSRIHPDATSVVLNPESALRKDFLDPESKEMAILSIDIRRSTDLMLKATSHDDYATFISGLTEKLKLIVIRNMGVFDKFTGDGILAYFPVFYSGEKAILNCLNASTECHLLFQEYYKANRNKFFVVIRTGLGVGIDYGKAKLVRINDEQTVVGTPVVYACRLSSAPQDRTYINQSAFERIKYLGAAVECNETDILIKNEGDAVVYDFIRLEQYETTKPLWK